MWLGFQGPGFGIEGFRDKIGGGEGREGRELPPGVVGAIELCHKPVAPHLVRGDWFVAQPVAPHLVCGATGRPAPGARPAPECLPPPLFRSPPPLGGVCCARALPQWVDSGRRFRCNVCGQLNDVPPEYFCSLDGEGRRADAAQRPELSCGTVEYIAPAEYMGGGRGGCGARGGAAATGAVVQGSRGRCVDRVEVVGSEGGG
eukprot:350293-Chlamydomonas_euryale.AAC.2